MIDFSIIYVNRISDTSPELDIQRRMNEDKIERSLNTLTKLNHFVVTVKSDIYLMCHCLPTVIIPAREHSEAQNTSKTQSIQVQTARKKSMRKVCSKSPGPTDVWIKLTPNSNE